MCDGGDGGGGGGDGGGDAGDGFGDGGWGDVGDGYGMGVDAGASGIDSGGDAGGPDGGDIGADIGLDAFGGPGPDVGDLSADGPGWGGYDPGDIDAGPSAGSAAPAPAPAPEPEVNPVTGSRYATSPAAFQAEVDRANAEMSAISERGLDPDTGYSYGSTVGYGLEGKGFFGRVGVGLKDSARALVDDVSMQFSPRNAAERGMNDLGLSWGVDRGYGPAGQGFHGYGYDQKGNLVARTGGKIDPATGKWISPSELAAAEAADRGGGDPGDDKDKDKDEEKKPETPKPKEMEFIAPKAPKKGEWVAPKAPASTAKWIQPVFHMPSGPDLSGRSPIELVPFR